MSGFTAGFSFQRASLASRSMRTGCAASRMSQGSFSTTAIECSKDRAMPTCVASPLKRKPGADTEFRLSAYTRFRQTLALALAFAPGPAGATGRVPGREMGGDGQRANLQRFSIVDGADIGYRRIVVACGAESELRIVFHRTATFERALAGGAGRHLGLADPNQRRNAAGMIVVSVRIENQLDVLEAEASRLDVLRDQRRRLRQSAVDEDVTLGRGDEDRPQVGRADEPGVAVDVKGRARPVPFRAIGSHSCGGSSTSSLELAAPPRQATTANNPACRSARALADCSCFHAPHFVRARRRGQWPDVRLRPHGRRSTLVRTAIPRSSRPC